MQMTTWIYICKKHDFYKNKKPWHTQQYLKKKIFIWVCHEFHFLSKLLFLHLKCCFFVLRRKWTFIKFLNLNQNIFEKKTFVTLNITMWMLSLEKLLWLSNLVIFSGYFSLRDFPFHYRYVCTFCCHKILLLTFATEVFCEWAEDTVGYFSGDTSTTLSSLFMNFGN